MTVNAWYRQTNKEEYNDERERKLVYMCVFNFDGSKKYLKNWRGGKQEKGSRKMYLARRNKRQNT